MVLNGSEADRTEAVEQLFAIATASAQWPTVTAREKTHHHASDDNPSLAVELLPLHTFGNNEVDNGNCVDAQYDSLYGASGEEAHHFGKQVENGDLAEAFNQVPFHGFVQKLVFA